MAEHGRFGEEKAEHVKGFAHVPRGTLKHEGQIGKRRTAPRGFASNPAWLQEVGGQLVHFF